jgi:hypothetical protein
MIKKNGSALLIVLIVSGSIAGLLISAAFLRLQNLHIRRAIKDFHSAHATRAALEEPGFYSGNLLCASSSGPKTDQVTLCGIPALPTNALSLSPIVDGRTNDAAHHIFPAALSKLIPDHDSPRCANSAVQQNRTMTSQGNQITSSAAISPQTCLEDNSLQDHSANNVSAISLVLYGDRKIAVRGYLESGLLSLSGSVVIISGGDIFIDHLVVSPGASLIIASLTGTLIINKLSASGSATLVGRQGVYINYGYPPQPASVRLELAEAERYIPLWLDRTSDN